MSIKTFVPGSGGSYNVLGGEEWVGRVVEIRFYQARRNMSDTLDYTDFRTVECTDALVWLGPVGHPHANEWIEARPLEFWEQFTWIDCSNHFSWRDRKLLVPQVDDAPLADPLLLVNLAAWRAHTAAEVRRKEEEARAANEAVEARRRAQVESEEAARQSVEDALLLAPSKGTLVTLDGLTGTVFWKGSKLWRGKWRGTVGVKDSRGVAHWIDVSHWVPSVGPKGKVRGK
jgi:hypothetical protein